MRTAAIAAAIALAGCATAPERAPLLTEVRRIEIKVPVKEPCVDPRDIEPLPGSAMPPKGADVDQLANGAVVDATRLLELARRQQDMLKACAKLSTTKE